MVEAAHDALYEGQNLISVAATLHVFIKRQSKKDGVSVRVT